MKLIKAAEEKFYWTAHSRQKMRYYRLSESRVKRVFRQPDRKEEGVAPRTIALMQRSGTRKNPSEIWMMYQIDPVKPRAAGAARGQQFNRVKIISAWRYPGISPKGKPPIPDEILFELNDELFAK